MGSWLSVSREQSWYFVIVGNSPQLGITDGTTRSVLKSGRSITNDTWHFLVATYDASTTTMKLYIDGALAKAKRDAVSSIQDGSKNFAIGARANGYWADWFNGIIDEVALWNRALSPEEIEQHYLNGLEGFGYCEVITCIPDHEALEKKIYKGMNHLNMAIFTDEDNQTARTIGQIGKAVDQLMKAQGAQVPPAPK